MGLKIVRVRKGFPPYGRSDGPIHSTPGGQVRPGTWGRARAAVQNPEPAGLHDPGSVITEE